MDHSELTYDTKNIDELKLTNYHIVNLLKREEEYCYCKLCDRTYPKKKVKLHWLNNKHMRYEYQKDCSPPSK